MTDTRRSGPETDPQHTTAGQRWQVVPPSPTPRPLHRRDLRMTLAIGAGRLVSLASKRLGMGSGAMIGGRITQKLQPKALAKLALDRRVVMVTGTIGRAHV